MTICERTKLREKEIDFLDRHLQSWKISIRSCFTKHAFIFLNALLQFMCQLLLTLKFCDAWIVSSSHKKLIFEFLHHGIIHYFFVFCRPNAIATKLNLAIYFSSRICGFIYILILKSVKDASQSKNPTKLNTNSSKTINIRSTYVQQRKW